MSYHLSNSIFVEQSKDIKKNHVSIFMADFKRSTLRYRALYKAGDLFAYNAIQASIRARQ